MILYQVNRVLFKKKILNSFCRVIHSGKFLYPLESRKLLQVSGNDASIFLQGLITNDMRHFEEGATSMYAMFLNNKGRVLYDTLIHKWDNSNSFMIECDKKIITILQKHLKLYKLKRLVEINEVNTEYKLWAFISPPNTVNETNIDPKNEINIYKDPRLTDLGFRILSSENIDEKKILETVGKDVVIEPSEEGYRYLRYKLGVSEGAEDMPPGTCFPLEVNCDYLHGVSFHKGCYIGQEVTARVHHTGVIRKRIMPLSFPDKVDDDLQIDSVISASDNPKSNLGKLKGFIQNYGIGLIRIKEALEAKALNVGKHSVEVLKPSWWPLEAPKEKATGIKTD